MHSRKTQTHLWLFALCWFRGSSGFSSCNPVTPTGRHAMGIANRRSSCGVQVVNDTPRLHSSALSSPAFSSAAEEDDERDSPQTRTVVERIFDLLDADGSGSIDRAELGHRLTRRGYRDRDVQSLLARLDDSDKISRREFQRAMVLEGSTPAVADLIFAMVDTDGSGTIELSELMHHLSLSGYGHDQIRTLFWKMDRDDNGQISRQEFIHAMQVEDTDCPRGYFLNSVRRTCDPLGPLGCASQRLELWGPFRRVYKTISNAFGMADPNKIRQLGVSFVLSYSILSNLNGAVSFSVAWYISCKRTGLSPLVPGQWKSLLASYGMIYGLIQLLKPFRVAAAIGMSKLSAEYLELTQAKLNCSRVTAIACQYAMGVLMMVVCATMGVGLVSAVTGIPILS